MSSINVCQRSTTSFPISDHPWRTFLETRSYIRYGMTWVRVLKCFPMSPPLYLVMYLALIVGAFRPSWLMDARRIWNKPMRWAFPSIYVICPQRYLTTPRSMVWKISVGVSWWMLTPGIERSRLIWSLSDWPPRSKSSSAFKWTATLASGSLGFPVVSFNSILPSARSHSTIKAVALSLIPVWLTVFFTFLIPLDTIESSICFWLQHGCLQEYTAHHTEI